MAICALEFVAQQAWTGTVQLFGTDISDTAIEKARAGLYPISIAHDVSPERLQRFFTKVEDGYRINKDVREMCAFVRHDLARDPPFSKLDLVSCRNVLIYFNPPLQRRVLATFHFALNLPGFLFIGATENLIDLASHFTLADKDAKIFSRTAVKSSLQLPPAELPTMILPPSKPPPAASFDVVRRMEGLLLDQYAPPGVVVNDRMDILHFRGRTGPYLEPAPGQPQYDLLKMAREGLGTEIRIAISLARTERKTVRRTDVQVQQNGSTRTCDVVVIPIGATPSMEPSTFAVLFEEVRPPELRAVGELPPGEPAVERTDDTRVAKLEGELASTKEYLQAIISEHQRMNEELTSANEQLVASNEELQSLNEELETAREELQSTNEELTTLNEEMQTRNMELNTANNDLVNILGTVEVPIVVVDLARRIRRFTPRARPILNILPSDVGRPIDDIKPAIAIDDLDRQIAEVIDSVTLKESEVTDREGRWYRLQIRPYTTVDKRIDGAVVSIVDIDALKRSLGAAEWARDYAQATVEAVQNPLVVLDESYRVLSANAAFHSTFELPKQAVEARSLYEILGGAFDLPTLRQALQDVIPNNKSFADLEIERDLPGLGDRSLSVSARMAPASTGVPMIVVAIVDITERKRLENERASLFAEVQMQKSRAEEANRAKDLFLATLSHELRTPLSTVLLQVDLLKRKGLDESRVRKAADTIAHAAKAQAQLVDDLLDVSRIVAGQLKIQVQDVHLPSVIHRAVDTVRAAAEAKAIQIHLELDEAAASVSGDPARLEQVVWNLLSNAIKFTPSGGEIWVSLDAVDGRARLQVRDSGIGIEPEFLPQVFDRFTQAEQTLTRTVGGLGLGLSIVRSLVEAHQGTIAVESPGKGKGSSFTATLPLLAKPRAVPVLQHAQQVRPANLRGLHVLVVDDDPGTREALGEVLSLSGPEVRLAESAARAMVLFEERKPDVIICDIAMPEEDGHSLMRRIRALGSEHGGNVPAMALSAMASDEDRRLSLAAGFQVHLAKPVDGEQLLAALDQLLPTTASP
jgi:two-component system CheB/CheR fusion protein